MAEKKVMKDNNRNNYKIISPLVLLFGMMLFLSFVFKLRMGTSLRDVEYWFLIATCLLVCAVFRKQLSRDYVIWTIVAGIAVKIGYIIYTDTWERQHDVISFGAQEGHAAYIEYILSHNGLPDFDPRSVWAFFQPPLHHIICAVWMKINIKLGIAQEQMQENVQVLTLVYMCLLTLAVYFICKELEMKNTGILVTMMIVSFHPCYILLSGSINNDALSICLSAIALYIAIRWYKNPQIAGAVLLAACIGLSMMAKLSAGLIAPGIALLMLYKVGEDRDHIVKYIIQFALFAVVVFPLGLWWPIRNKIMWDMPVNYIPEVGGQLEHSSMVSRLFDIRMNSVYPSLINYGDAYDEYNVFLAMIKTALFGEYNYNEVSRRIYPFAVIVFVSFVILIVLEIIAMVRVLIVREASPKLPYKLFLLATAVCLTAGYFMFALGYNNFSAQDFRYSSLLISVMAIFLGLWVDRLDMVYGAKSTDSGVKSKIMILRKFIIGIVFAFAISSMVVYMLLGYLEH